MRRENKFFLFYLAAADTTQIFLFFFVKLHFYPQTFRKLQNSPKIFYVFQKHSHLEGSRCLSKVQTHSLKITSLSLKFWVFSLFPQNFDFFFQFGPLTPFDFKNNYQINIIISQNIFHNIVFTSQFHL